MVKRLSVFLIWVAAVFVSSFYQVMHPTVADPTDDLSLTLQEFPEANHYQLMSSNQVSEVLLDRLSLFPKSQIPDLAHHLSALCRQYRFDPAFVLSLIQVESSFRVKVVSPNGAVGLMQVMPQTGTVIAREWGLRLPSGNPIDLVTDQMLMDPFINLTLGIAYLAWLRDRYQRVSPYFLLAAYNLGPSRMNKLLQRESFTPVQTKKYYEAIRKAVVGMRFYRRANTELGV